jgi:hypothetical protein
MINTEVIKPVITSDLAKNDLAKKSTDLANWTSGIASQAQNVATNQANQKAAAISANQTAADNALKTKELDAKTQTASTLNALKSTVAGKTQESQANLVMKDENLAGGGVQNSAQGQTRATQPGTYYNQSGQAITLSAEDLKNPATSMLGAGWSMNKPAGTTGTTETNTSGASKTTTTDDLQAKQDAEDASYQAKIQQFVDGTFPLTAEEQAAINDLQKRFDNIIEQQKLANRNYEGGTNQLELISGRSRYAPDQAMGNIKSTIDQGLAKVADLESKAREAIYNMKQAMLDKNYKRIGALHDEISSTLAAKQKAIHDASSAINEEADRLLKNQQTQLNIDKLKSDAANANFGKAIPAIADALTGDSTKDAETIKQLSDYYGLDQMNISGQVQAYKNKESDATVKQDEQMIAKGYRTINPADASKLKDSDIRTLDGRVYAKPKKVTTKVIKVGSGKSSQTYEVTYDEFGKEVNRKKTSSGGTSLTPSNAPTPKPPKEKDVVKKMESKVNNFFKVYKGVDNKVSPQDFQKAKSAWIEDGGNPTAFDTKFRGWKNPNNSNY